VNTGGDDLAVPEDPRVDGVLVAFYCHRSRELPMFGSTFALAMGVMLLALVAFSADPGALDIVAVLGMAFVAVGCALHTAAIVGELAFLPPVVRGLATAIGWVAWALAIVWVLSLVDPRTEVLLAILMTPAALGMAGVLTSSANRGWAMAFLIEAVALIALLGPIFLRQLAS
jgi:hypothetical protein